MIVMKFGGTSVQDAAAIDRAAEIVSGRANRSPVVVVSAMARVTDSLVHIARAAKERRADEALNEITELRKRHFETARELLNKSAEPVDGPFSLRSVEAEIDNQFAELDNLVRSVATLGELTARSHDSIVSFGERLSSVIIEAAFRSCGIAAELVDSRQFIITDD